MHIAAALEVDKSFVQSYLPFNAIFPYPALLQPGLTIGESRFLSFPMLISVFAARAWQLPPALYQDFGKSREVPYLAVRLSQNALLFHFTKSQRPLKRRSIPLYFDFVLLAYYFPFYLRRPSGVSLTCYSPCIDTSNPHVHSLRPYLSQR